MPLIPALVGAEAGRTGTKAAEKPCLEKNKKQQQQKNHPAIAHLYFVTCLENTALRSET